MTEQPFRHSFIVAALAEHFSDSPTADAVGSQSVGKEWSYPAVETDTRALTPGCLFVALQGEKFDAHDFLEDAVAGGAGGLLIHRLPALRIPAGVSVFLVRDTLKAYRALAGEWRRRFQVPVLAIGGSVGKTTTKEMIAAILGGRYRHVVKTAGSQNGFVGIPMTLLKMRPETEAAVIEIGIDAVGAMAEHASLTLPTAALITAIAPEHMEFLKDMETVAAEECRLLSDTDDQGGACIINADDPRILSHWGDRLAANHLKSRSPADAPGASHISFGLSDERNPETSAWEPAVQDGWVRARLAEDGGELLIDSNLCAQFRLKMQQKGRHNARNLAGAVALALSAGLTPEEIKRGWSSYQPLNDRSNVIKLYNGLTLIRDEYNASPASVRAALALLGSPPLQRKQRKIFCFGDMLELGIEEEAFHRQLAPDVLAAGVTHTLTFGPRARWLTEELNLSRGTLQTAAHFADQGDLLRALEAFIAAGDRENTVILVKGSRGMRMEKISQGLLTPFQAGPA